MPRILIIGISLALFLIVGVVLTWPKYQNLKNIQIQLENIKTEFRYRDDYYQNLRSLSQKLQEFEVELAAIDSALPLDSSSAALSFSNFLLKTSSENGLILQTIGSFSLSSLTGKTNIQIISIPITVSGSYSSLKNFLNTLEKSARIIEVNGISFSSPGEEGLFGFSIQIQTHSY